MNRRDFLKATLSAAPILWAGCATSRQAAAELRADLVVIGGGLGGCAAALAAARNGLKVIVTDETDWIGGQWTAQAVPPDENQWVETFGCTRSYQQLRQGVRDYYRRFYPLTAKAAAEKYLNPGKCWVSRLGCEPRVPLAVLYEMLAPYLGSGRVRILLRHKPVAAETNGDRVEAVRLKGLESGKDVVLRGQWFADATEQGDLLPLTKTEYVIGAESRRNTGEPNARPTAEPHNLQGFTMCFAMDYLPGENHTIDRPAEYDYWRNFEMKVTGRKPYRLVSFEADSKKIGFDPAARKGFWTYRRIADKDLFRPGFYEGDITIVNWPQNDYSFGLICNEDEAAVRRNIARAKQLSLSVLYWLQTEAPRPDGGTGWPGLRLCPDIVGTEDGLAKYPYIREGRRILADYTIVEQDVLAELRKKEGKTTAKSYFDSVGIGSYAMDLHPSSGGDRGMFGATFPFQIPLGALIPRRVENLLAACKNIGTTHLTNGCYRLHPIEWNIGEAAGTLAAFCGERGERPRGVRNTPALLEAFQSLLRQDGVPLEWPEKIRGK